MRSATTWLIFGCCLGIAVLVTVVMNERDENRQLTANYRKLAVETSVSCEQSNTARRQLNVWGDAVASFMLSAETARRAAGSKLDIATAAQYAEDRASITPLTLRDCP